MNKTYIIIVTLIILFFHNLAFAQSQYYKTIEEVPQQTWDKLATKKIYFGHQSVGSNIVNGIEQILNNHPNIKLTVIRSDKTGNMISRPAFVHGSIGQNMHPYSKIESFQQKMEEGYGLDADIAFFKFCFIDFNPETDINSLFKEYKKTVDSIIIQHPKSEIILVTTPLTCYAPGPHGWVKRTKDLIKSVIGKLNVYDHRSANIFNEKLVETYKEKVPIFDLAKFESTYPDGSRSFYKEDGVTYYELVQEYTTDGGHLNEGGKKIIAEKLLLFLANLINQDPQK